MRHCASTGSLAIARGLVDVEASTYADRAHWTVIDNGPGIPEADKVRVFNRFYRCEDASTPARDLRGSGLRLSIARAIAERHDAIVNLHTPGSGRASKSE
jgi:signal transduction histidine kinase